MLLLNPQVNNRPRSAQSSGGVGLETCRVPFGRAFQPAFFQAGSHAGRQAGMPTPRALQAARFFAGLARAWQPSFRAKDAKTTPRTPRPLRFFAGLAGPWRAWREICANLSRLRAGCGSGTRPTIEILCGLGGTLAGLA
jgi:hypothetical protein